MDKLQKFTKQVEAFERTCATFVVYRALAQQLATQFLQLLGTTTAYPQIILWAQSQNPLLLVIQALETRFQALQEISPRLSNHGYRTRLEGALRLSKTHLEAAVAVVRLNIEEYCRRRGISCPSHMLYKLDTLSGTIERLAQDHNCEGIQPQATNNTGVTLPWLHDIFIDNYTDLLMILAQVPPDGRYSKKHLETMKRSDEAMSPKSINLSPFEPRLFALIIGINNYADQSGLSGACTDALAVEDYLKTTLKVPSRRITVLLNHAASRAAIINGFERLKTNEDIQRGDAIIIFYAGAPGWIPDTRSEGTGKISAIVPQDHHEGDGASALISDDTIRSLLTEISEAKGNNITLILDCGYSRRDALRSLDSHVLLSACMQTQVAREVAGRGVFTKALLSLLKATPPGQLSYTEALRRINIPKQSSIPSPHCEGRHQDRPLFNKKLPFIIHEIYQIHNSQNENGHFLKIGSTDGISLGTEFDVYSDVAAVELADPIGEMVARTVTAFETIVSVSSASRPPDLGRSVPVALLRKAPPIRGSRLFVPLDERLLPVFDALVYLQAIPRPIVFVLVGDKTNADLAIEIYDDGRGISLGFTILDGRITQHGTQHLNNSVSLDFDSAVRVLSTAAHYFHQLNLSDWTSTNEELIEIQLVEIQYRIPPYRGPTPVGISLIAEGILSLEVNSDFERFKDEVFYGINIINRTDQDLYPYIFYLDNKTLCIELLHGRSPLVGFVPEVEPPLRSENFLSLIGHGEGKDEALSFCIPYGQEISTGYLKFMFFTKPVDLSHIECESPFEVMPSAHCPPNVVAWDVGVCPYNILVPVVLKKGGSGSPEV